MAYSLKVIHLWNKTIVYCSRIYFYLYVCYQCLSSLLFVKLFSTHGMVCIC